MSESPIISMVAGEPSGDVLAALLLQNLRARWPGLRVHGIGGPQMRAQGFDAWWPVERLSVRGYLEVLPRLPELLRIRRQLAERLLRERPDLFIGVDAPDFNFDLEVRLKDAGLKTLHFISPSFWAWRPEKLLKLKAAVDHVLCLFPFEPDLLAEHGIAATYVGHPMANIIPMEPDRLAARHALQLPETAPVVALLPGSRSAEVKHLMPRFLKAAALIRQAHADVHFVVPAVAHVQRQIEAAARASGLGSILKVVPGQSHTALAACNVTLIASGTATLEAALFKRPMVIAYAMPGISYHLMRRKRQLPWIGLPNVLCAPREWLRRPPHVLPHIFADRPDAPFVVPELVQDAATPQALAQAVLDWLAAPARIHALEQRFAALHQELQRDTARLAADAIETLIAH